MLELGLNKECEEILKVWNKALVDERIKIIAENTGYEIKTVLINLKILEDLGYTIFIDGENYRARLTEYGRNFLTLKRKEKNIPFTPSVLLSKFPSEPLKRTMINYFKTHKIWVGVDEFDEMIINMDKDLCIGILYNLHTYHIIKKHPSKNKFKICTKDEIIELYLKKIGR